MMMDCNVKVCIWQLYYVHELCKMISNHYCSIIITVIVVVIVIVVVVVVVVIKISMNVIGIMVAVVKAAITLMAPIIVTAEVDIY